MFVPASAPWPRPFLLLGASSLAWSTGRTCCTVLGAEPPALPGPPSSELASRPLCALHWSHRAVVSLCARLSIFGSIPGSQRTPQSSPGCDTGQVTPKTPEWWCRPLFLSLPLPQWLCSFLVPTVPTEDEASRSALVLGHRRKALFSFEILAFIFI